MLLKIAAEVAPVLRREQPIVPLSLAPDVQQAARAILADRDATATAVFRAACALLGGQVMNWEPESIWMELRDLDIAVPGPNKEKILAVSSLIQTPAFYWDVNVFEDTALAFNSEPVIVEVLQEASPAQLCWAVYEAEVLLRSQGKDPEFDYEPAKYAAVCMHRAGLVVAPDGLEFAQEELDKLTQGHKDLKDEVNKRWAALNGKTKLEDIELQETPVDVQLGMLAATQLYVNERAARYRRELDSLKSA